MSTIYFPASWNYARMLRWLSTRYTQYTIVQWSMPSSARGGIATAETRHATVSFEQLQVWKAAK